MKKIIIIDLFIAILFFTGCNKANDNFEHYDLKNRDINSYTYHKDNANREIYALSDITPDGSDSFITGLFYKVSKDDYILLEKLEYSKKDSFSNDTVYQFYGNKLYGVGNGESPMVFEIQLQGKKSKLNELEYDLDGKFNPFLIREIKSISNDSIEYMGYITINNSNTFSNIICHINDKKCVIENE